MSLADGIDALEEMRVLYPDISNVLGSIIRAHLLPVVIVSDHLIEAAARIDADGTPSQVGPTSQEARAWAKLIKPDN